VVSSNILLECFEGLCPGPVIRGMDAKEVTEDIFNQTPIVGEKRESGKFTDRYSNTNHPN
jgi:hypothetical protein